MSKTSSAPRVCALVSADPALESSLAQQARAADVLVRARGPVWSGLDSALGAEADWIWLLDGSAAPAPDALQRLLDAVEGAPPGPAPVLLASKVVDLGGALVDAQAPWPRRGSTEVALSAAPRRLLPVRAARGGSLLLAAGAVAGQAPPVPELGDAAALEWTARLLRDATGFLVTASLAHSPAAPDAEVAALSTDPCEDLRAGIAMVRGRGWYPKEKLWLTAELAGRAALSARARRAGGLALAQAAGQGWRIRS